MRLFRFFMAGFSSLSSLGRFSAGCSSSASASCRPPSHSITLALDKQHRRYGMLFIPQ